MEYDRLTPKYFLKMRNSRGKVCPYCGGENTSKTSEFERDHHINEKKRCADCGRDYSFVYAKY